ncbi:MAG TPA: hypothetical protein VL443_29480 [Cyclobacteriaceae bacterium]|jgi:hypothetical protein|nr:hypothetical protein [Cyclobacteriaceae bacterium]
MAIVFQSQQDPWGLSALGSAFGQGFQKTKLLQEQERQKIAGEERLQARKQSFGPLLDEALTILQDPEATPEMKISALSKYGQASGDTKTITPLLNQVIKDSTREAQSKADYDFLRPVYENLGIPLPEEAPKGISPQAVRSVGNIATPRYESESDKLAAQASSEYGKNIMTDYEGAELSNTRLKQQLNLAESGKLPTPSMVKTMDVLGVPLSIWSNPASELYEKITQENVRDISKIFPGQIKNFEIESYMKTIPQLINSDEGKKLIINNQLLANKQKIETGQAFRDIVEENNGKIPRDIQTQVMDRTRESRLRNAELYKENIERAINVTQYPTQKVERGTPITVQTARNYINRADFEMRKNKEKMTPEEYRAKSEELAKKLAAEDGYDPKSF